MRVCLLEAEWAPPAPLRVRRQWCWLRYTQPLKRCRPRNLSAAHGVAAAEITRICTSRCTSGLASVRGEGVARIARQHRDIIALAGIEMDRARQRGCRSAGGSIDRRSASAIALVTGGLHVLAEGR